MSVLDEQALWACRESDSLQTIRQNGIRKEWFNDNYQDLFEQLCSHYLDYGTMPGEPVLENEYEIENHGPVEPLDYYADKLSRRHERMKMLNGLEEIGSAVSNDDIDQARSLCRQVASESSGDLQATDISENVETRAERYTTPQDGVIGIPSPWRWLDERMSGHEDGEMNAVVARRGTGKCVAADSMITADDGRRMTVEEFVNETEESTVSLNEESGQLQESTVKDWVDSGKKQGYKVTTRRGREVTVSEDHPFLTPDGWTKICDGLEEGDTIGIVSNYEGLFGDRSIPVEEVELLALYVAEGIKDEWMARFSNGDDEVVEMAERIADHFGVDLSRDTGSDVNYSFVGTMGAENPVSSYLKDHGLFGQYSSDMEIPDIVFELEESLVRRFIEVLFDGDGSFWNRQFEYSSASKELVEQLRHLLLRFGIESWVRPKENDGQGAWVLDIRGDHAVEFSEKFNLISRKQGAVEQEPPVGGNPNYVNIDLPAEKIAEIEDQVGGRWADVTWKKAVDQGMTERFVSRGSNALKRCGISQKDAGILGGLIDDEDLSRLDMRDVMFDEIVSIETVGEVQMYDLSIEGTHNFVVNDTVVHNTWCLCIQAVEAIKAGHSVIIYSTEMSKEQIARRVDSLIMAIDDDVLKQGDYDEEERLIDRMAEHYDSDGRLWMVGTEEFRTTEDITAINETFQPDMALVDGIYRVRPMQSFQKLNGKIGATAEEIKDMALRQGIPVNITHQLGSEAENRERVGVLDDIAWTSRLQWECDWIVGIDPHNYDEAMDEGEPDQMDLEILKHRGADLSNEERYTVINWDLPYDWTKMDFQSVEDEATVQFE